MADISNRIDILIKKTYYIYERFHVDATFAMLYVEKPIEVKELSEYARISDQLIRIDENHYFIIFAFTQHKNAHKASQNIIHKLDMHFRNSSSCIALDTFNATKSPKSVLVRLKQILIEIKKTSNIRIETEDIFDY